MPALISCLALHAVMKQKKQYNLIIGSSHLDLSGVKKHLDLFYIKKYDFGIFGVRERSHWIRAENPLRLPVVSRPELAWRPHSCQI